MAETVAIYLSEQALEAGFIELGNFLLFNGAVAVEAAATLAAVYTLREDYRKQQNRARDSYNASLKDRYLMVRGATEPRQVVLGRQRVSGPLAFIGSYGADREHLVFTAILAAHEIDAVEAVYFDDEEVELDGSGNVLSVSRRDLFSINVASDTFTLSSEPEAATVSASVAYGSTTVSLSVSVSGSDVTVSGATAGQTGTVTIRYRPKNSPFVANNGDTVRTATITLDGSGNGNVTLPVSPTPGSVYVTWREMPPRGAEDVNITSFASVVGSLVTVTGDVAHAGEDVVVSYTSTDGNYRANVKAYLGAAGQTADADMVAALPDLWTSSHTMSGLAYLRLRLDYDPDAFPSGLPNVSARVRGAKVYDPRNGTTAWSENPVLLMRYVAISPLLGRQSSGVVNDVNLAAQATVCDQSSAYVVDGQTFTRARYTAGLTVKTSTRAADALNDLAQAMAGKWTVVDGQLRVKAGSYAAPLQTLDDSWLANTQAVEVQSSATRQDVFNTITGKFADERSDFKVVAFPTVPESDSDARIVADGQRLPLDMQFNAITFTGQAQQVAACLIRDARQGIRLSVTCNMRAYCVEPFDTLLVTLSRFGWSAKPFEVVDVSWSLDGIVLALKETDPAAWDLGTSFSAVDPAPNTLLPDPGKLPTVDSLTLTSGTNELLPMADGTVASRIKVAWTPITDKYVAEGGGVEVRYGFSTSDSGTWQSVKATDGQSVAYLTGVQDGGLYFVQARAFNRLANGPWTAPELHQVVGKTALPANVSGLAAALTPAGVLITVNPSTEADVTTGGALELRYGASWAAGTRIFRGPADRYTWPRPAAGAYTVRAKWIDSSGNESSSDATLSVTVSDATVSTTAATVTVTQQIGAPAGTLVASVSITPDRSGKLLMTAGGSAHTTTAASGATEDYVSLVVQLGLWDGSGETKVYEAYMYDGQPGFSVTVNHAISALKQVSVTAGTTYTLRARALKLTSGATSVIDSIELRGELIPD